MPHGGGAMPYSNPVPPHGGGAPGNPCGCGGKPPPPPHGGGGIGGPAGAPGGGPRPAFGTPPPPPACSPPMPMPPPPALGPLVPGGPATFTERNRPPSTGFPAIAAIAAAASCALA